jgi:hypothetical protein
MATFKSNPSKTVLTIVVGFVFVFLVTHQKWALSTAFLVGLIGLSSEFIALKIEWIWMKIALLLSYIVPNILLSLIFFIILTPIALVMKITGKKDPLSLKNNADSLFKTHPKTFDKAYFEKYW